MRRKGTLKVSYNNDYYNDYYKGNRYTLVCIIHYMIPEKYLMQEGFCA